MKTPPIKNIVLWLIVIFLVYAILTQPTSAADMVGGAWDVVAESAKNVATFFDELIAR